MPHSTPNASPAERAGSLRVLFAVAEIAPWVKFVSAQAEWREAFVYFKHEETGVGPKFAQTFMKLTHA